MTRFPSLALTVAAVAAMPLAAQANILFSDDFEDGLGSTRWSSPFFSNEAGANYDGIVNYAFDYSGFEIGGPGTSGQFIPQAPGSSGTTALAFANNLTDETGFDGFAQGVSILGLSLPATYRLTAEVFIYYGGGGGSSEHAMLGVNTDGTAVPHTFINGPGAGAGQGYGLPHNSGLGSTVGDDFFRTNDGVLTDLAGNGPSPQSPSAYGITYDSAPVIFNDDGAEGYLDSRWVSVTLDVINGSTVNLYIEGALIDSYGIQGGETNTGDIFLGSADVFDSVNLNNFTLWDNVIVTDVIPAPATATLAGLGSVLVATRRRRD